MADVAAERGKDALDTFLDLAIEDKLNIQFTMEIFNADEKRIPELITDSRTMIGLSDGGAHVDMLCDAGYCTYLLGTWVRDKGAISLEHAVKRITSEPARLLQLERPRPSVGWSGGRCDYLRSQDGGLEQTARDADRPSWWRTPFGRDGAGHLLHARQWSRVVRTRQTDRSTSGTGSARSIKEIESLGDSTQTVPILPDEKTGQPFRLPCSFVGGVFSVNLRCFVDADHWITLTRRRQRTRARLQLKRTRQI